MGVRPEIGVRQEIGAHPELWICNRHTQRPEAYETDTLRMIQTAVAEGQELVYATAGLQLRYQPLHQPLYQPLVPASPPTSSTHLSTSLSTNL